MKPFINSLLCIGLIFTALPVDAAHKKRTIEADAAVAEESAPSVPAAEQTPAPARPAPLVKEPAQPAPPAVKSKKITAADELCAWDAKLKNLKADFTQTTEYDGVLISSSGGTVYFSAPNLLRLDQKDKDGKVTQAAFTDKKNIKIYDGAGRHISDMGWKDWESAQTNKALFDFGNYCGMLNSHKTVSVTKKETETVILLTPLVKTADAYELYVTVSNADFFPTAITLKAELMTTEAKLQNSRKNGVLPKDTFGGI